MGRSHAITSERWRRLAKLGGMSKEQFDSASRTPRSKTRSSKSRLTASKELDVNSTPTFFVNGTKFTGAPTVEEFDKLLSRPVAEIVMRRSGSRCRSTGCASSGSNLSLTPTELAIEPGLTGIVGPNGCGKSNLVEALRWVMGETSAKRLRGGGDGRCDFRRCTPAAGAQHRRGRADASTTARATRPFAFNDREEIEIVRRIERGGGSAYRVNGREVRARDVQLLFADAATGGPFRARWSAKGGSAR